MTVGEVIHTVICLQSLESQSDQHFMDLLIPRTASLLQTIKTFLQQADKTLLVIFDKSLRLSHVDHMFEFAVEIGRYYVHLMDLPSFSSSNGKKCSDQL